MCELTYILEFGNSATRGASMSISTCRCIRPVNIIIISSKSYNNRLRTIGDLDDGLSAACWWLWVEGWGAVLGACGIGGGSEFRGGGNGCPCVRAACVRGKLRRPRWASSPTGGGRNRLLARAGVFGDSPTGLASTSATRLPSSPHMTVSTRRRQSAAVTASGNTCTIALRPRSSRLAAVILRQFRRTRTRSHNIIILPVPVE